MYQAARSCASVAHSAKIVGRFKCPRQRSRDLPKVVSWPLATHDARTHDSRKPPNHPKTPPSKPPSLCGLEVAPQKMLRSSVLNPHQTLLHKPYTKRALQSPRAQSYPVTFLPDSALSGFPSPTGPYSPKQATGHRGLDIDRLLAEIGDGFLLLSPFMAIYGKS